MMTDSEVARSDTDRPIRENSVIVFRRAYLALSETFIVDHIDTLRRWVPVPVFERRVSDGLRSSHHPGYAIHGRYGGKLRLPAILLARFGWSLRLDAIVRNRSVLLIHAHFLTDAVRMLRFARRHGLPLIATAHGFDATMHEQAMLQSASGRLLVRNRDALKRDVALIVCVSDFIRRELIAAGYPPEKLVTQYLGIDLATYRPGMAAGRRRGVLSAGRLVEKKGVHCLIAAWRQLDPVLKAQGLTIIGGGPEEARLKAMAGDDSTIRFLGPQSREAVREAMTSHRVFGFPSLRAQSGDAEGMGIVAMEAQAVGTPVVGFDEGPLREVIAPDRSGFVVPPGNVAAMAAAMERLLRDDDLATRMGEEGLAHVAATFDLAANTASLERLYDRVAAQREAC